MAEGTLGGKKTKIEKKAEVEREETLSLKKRKRDSVEEKNWVGGEEGRKLKKGRICARNRILGERGSGGKGKPELKTSSKIVQSAQARKKRS